MPDPSPSHSPHGIHIAMECSGCRADLLTDHEALRAAMISCAADAGATVIDSLIHAYNPIGLSGVVVIAESHLAVHTWPEIGYASFDIYTCGEESLAEKIASNLERTFNPASVSRQVLERRPPGVN
ncbi:adenosylmethionine decarboxylase [Verrucomicrobiaceae bacterium 227]